MKAFLMLAAILNYIAQDDPTIQFAAKELCREMSSPTSQDFSKLKKLVRFLVGVEEVLWEYPWQIVREATSIKIQVDSDWAGCERTRMLNDGAAMSRPAGRKTRGRMVTGLDCWTTVRSPCLTTSELLALAMYGKAPSPWRGHASSCRGLEGTTDGWDNRQM